MTGLSQLQALGLVVAFMLALSLIVSVCVFITALIYEARDRAARRRRRAYLRGVARSEAARPAVRRSNGRWAA